MLFLGLETTSSTGSSTASISSSPNSFISALSFRVVGFGSGAFLGAF